MQHWGLEQATTFNALGSVKVKIDDYQVQVEKYNDDFIKTAEYRSTLEKAIDKLTKEISSPNISTDYREMLVRDTLPYYRSAIPDSLRREQAEGYTTNLRQLLDAHPYQYQYGRGVPDEVLPSIEFEDDEIRLLMRAAEFAFFPYFDESVTFTDKEEQALFESCLSLRRAIALGDDEMFDDDVNDLMIVYITWFHLNDMFSSAN